MYGTRIIWLHLAIGYRSPPSSVLSLASSRRANLSTACCCMSVSWENTFSYCTGEGSSLLIWNEDRYQPSIIYGRAELWLNSPVYIVVSRCITSVKYLEKRPRQSELISKVLRNFLESTEKVLGKYWESSEKVLRTSWVSLEKIERKSWEVEKSICIKYKSDHNYVNSVILGIFWILVPS